MKKLIVLLAIVSIQANAYVYTNLTAPAEPSDNKIKGAITKLEKALENEDKSYNLKAARQLLAKTTKKIKFKAAVYINGNKQFNDSGDQVHSWNFGGYCYKGEVSEAVKLINTAIDLDYWNFDEEWIDSAQVESNNRILLTIMDGPNEYQWTESFGPCSK